MISSQFKPLSSRCRFTHAAALPYIRFASSDTKPSVLLSFHENSSVAILTLSNPKRKNALTVSMMEQFDRHVSQTLSKWSRHGTTGSNNETTCRGNNSISDDIRSKENNARVLILTGVEGTFCSGLDLHDNGLKEIEDDDGSNSSRLKEGIHMIEHMTRVTNQLMSLPVLSVCAVDGYAVGGGAELQTCTDLVVLSRSAKIQFVHAKRGASMGWGGGRRLVKKVGRQRALRMLLLGEWVYGDEEARSGTYADAVAEEGETALEATMRMVVDPILQLPCSQSIRAIKRAVSAADRDGEVIDSSGNLKVNTNMAMKGEIESFMSVWGGDSNKQQIQKAKDRLRDKGTNK